MITFVEACVVTTDWRKKFFQIFQSYLELGGYEELA